MQEPPHQTRWRSGRSGGQGRLALVVDGFPIRSQTFITQLIDAFAQRAATKNHPLLIVALGPIDLEALKVWAPSTWANIESGSVVLVDGKVVPKRLIRSRRDYLWLWPHLLQALVRSPRQFRLGIRQSKPWDQIIRCCFWDQLVVRHRLDVIHVQFFSQAGRVAGWLTDINFKGQLWAMARGRDVTVTSQATNQTLNHLLAAPFFQGVTAVSSHLAQQVSHLGVREASVHVVYGGLVLARFCFQRPSTRGVDVRGSNAPHPPVRLIQVGRLVEKKGHDLSLELMRVLQHEPLVPAVSVSLRMVGEGALDTPGVDISLRTWQEKTEAMGLGDWVAWLGGVAPDRVLSLLSESDVLLMPSLKAKDGDSEGIPNAIKEAMAIGVVCVISDQVGLNDLVCDGEHAYVFQAGDLWDYVATVRRAVADRARWDEVALNARALVEAHFDVDAQVSQLLELYDRSGGEAVSWRAH